MAVEQIWNESSAQLGQFIRARVADPATAEDILHDVFVKFLSRLDEFREPAKVQGWLFLVARNAIIYHYRTRKPKSELPQSLPTELPRIDVTEMEDLHVVFRRIIDRLPKPYREALVLTAFVRTRTRRTGQAAGHFTFRREIPRAARTRTVEGDVARFLRARVRPHAGHLTVSVWAGAPSGGGKAGFETKLARRRNKTERGEMNSPA